jgi:dihydrofolate reductase
MRISIIVAVAQNGVIGRRGALPWRMSDDLRRFKRLTTGHTVVMGRRTWESIGRPLPGRRMIVISRNSNYRIDVDGTAVAPSLDGALRLAKENGEDEAFVIGGAELFREALPLADRLYFTEVRAHVDGDTYLPPVDWSQWRLVESLERSADEKNEYCQTFKVFERVH